MITHVSPVTGQLREALSMCLIAVSTCHDKQFFLRWPGAAGRRGCVALPKPGVAGLEFKIGHKPPRQ